METLANKLTPFYPIHPCEIIKDEIEYRGISQRKLASKMGMSSIIIFSEAIALPVRQ